MDTLSKSKAGNIKVVLVEPHRQIRAAIRYSLHEQGFENIREISDVKELHEVLEASDVDLLISAVSDKRTIPGAQSLETIRKIRRQECGKNPFVVTIALASESSETIIMSAMEAGFDDIILKPFSSDMLIKKIQRLMSDRHPFVVTPDYVGPDRRNDVARKTSCTIIEVPNPLRAIMVEGASRQSLKTRLQNQADQIRLTQVHATSKMVLPLIGRVMPYYLDDKICPEGVQMFKELKRLAAIALSIVSPRDSGAKEVMFHGLIDTVTDILDRCDGTPNLKEFENLRGIESLLHQSIGEASA